MKKQLLAALAIMSCAVLLWCVSCHISTTLNYDSEGIYWINGKSTICDPIRVTITGSIEGQQFSGCIRIEHKDGMSKHWNNVSIVRNPSGYALIVNHSISDPKFYGIAFVDEYWRVFHFFFFDTIDSGPRDWASEEAEIYSIPAYDRADALASVKSLSKQSPSFHSTNWQ